LPNPADYGVLESRKSEIDSTRVEASIGNFLSQRGQGSTGGISDCRLTFARGERGKLRATLEFIYRG
jgi:hypothetical protein